MHYIIRHWSPCSSHARVPIALNKQPYVSTRIWLQTLFWLFWANFFCLHFMTDWKIYTGKIIYCACSISYWYQFSSRGCSSSTHLRRAGATCVGIVWDWEGDCARGEEGNVFINTFLDGKLLLVNGHLFYKSSTSLYFHMEMSEVWTSDSKIQARRNLEVGEKNNSAVSFLSFGKFVGQMKEFMEEGNESSSSWWSELIF